MSEELPPPTNEVKRLVQLVGPAAALAVIERWGGTRLYVPKNPSANAELNRAAGAEGARNLAAAYGGDFLKVPRAVRWRILAYRTMGLSYAQIARRAGCTEKHVGTTLRSEGLTRAQLDLFS